VSFLWKSIWFYRDF